MAAATAAIALPQADAAGTDAAARTITGTAWAVDARTGKTAVAADSTVRGGQWDRLMAAPAASRSGWSAPRGAHPVRRRGDAIFTGWARCTLGFTVTTGDGRPGILTAGHCAAAGRQGSLARGGRPVATGLHQGRVTALNATVNYPEGRVTGLIRTTVCAEGGDSGGPLFTRDGSAIGINPASAALAAWPSSSR